jgi:hypothetical protein
VAVAPGLLGDAIAAHALAIAPPGRPLRIIIDGPRSVDLGAVATAMVGPLRIAGRPVVAVTADGFWRDASLRLEYGRQDADSYYNGWLDLDALRREVLDPLGPGGSREYLPSLRDPVTNRATRAPRRSASSHTALILHGDMLLGAGLPAELEVHFHQSPAARARRIPSAWSWTLPASRRYDDEVGPSDLVDLVVRADDPAHPAVRLRSG